MNTKDLYKHLHRTAPYGDLEFFLRVARMSATLRAEGEALMTQAEPSGRLTIARGDFYRRLRRLHDLWRHERNVAERNSRKEQVA